MKKLTILLPTLLFALSVSAQTKHIPAKNTIILTDKEIIAISAHIDSVQQALVQTSTIPSIQVQGLNQRLNLALYAIWRQISFVPDSAKKVEVKK
ncbi:MAG TPA: hypothetical protein VN922_17065 [Bacteroidia bacterium]|nr:hypothetical protein [Bacteroidia bacterium]